MATYRKYNWQEYFKEFEQANLTQTEFCKQHGLNAKYFSQKLAQHKAIIVKPLLLKCLSQQKNPAYRG